MRARLVPLALVLAALTAGPLMLLLASCILVVSPETYGSTCLFAGKTSQCGSCVASQCQPQVNACCTEGSCDGALAAVERCAERGDCAIGGSSVLAACVADKCAGVCRPREGTSRTRCTEPALGAGSACRCAVAVGEAPNDAFCDPLAYRDTICCAPKGWPAPGLACTCEPLSCNATADGCFCSLVTTVPKQRACAGFKCCATNDACICRAKDCFAFETPVESCAIQAVGCREGQTRVDVCSVREP